MAGGIGGFAEGFSSGLGQGMGIIQSVRADKRAEAAQKKQFEQIDQSMRLAEAQNNRANAAEGRAVTEFEGRQEDRKWTNENLRPLQLEQTKLAVEKYKQDIKIGGVEYATKELQLKFLPRQLQLGIDEAEQRMDLARRSDARAERTLEHSIDSWNREFGLRVGQDGRQAEQHAITMAGSVLPIYTQMLASGVEPPPQLTQMIANSPFGISQQLEVARASEDFPKILQMAGRGDFSFMRDGSMSESAFSLARPVGMRIARDRGFDATSARVVGVERAANGGVWLNITARDPKTGRYATFKHGVNADHLVGQMELSARNGTALRNHPAYAQLQQALPGYISALGGGDIRKAAGETWDQQFAAYSKIIDGGDTESPAYKQASDWLAKNSNREQFVNNMVAGQRRSQAVRGDASPQDWSRVSSTVSRYTGLTDPADVSKRANGALEIMGRLGSADQKAIPGIWAKVKELASSSGGGWSNNPALKVRAYYEIQKDPKLRAEMARFLRGGQGAGNPSQGGGAIRYPANFNPVAEVRQRFGAQATSGFRTQAHQDNLIRQGLTQTRHSSHTRGDGIDFVTPLGMSKSQFIAQLQRMYPHARIAPSNGRAVHVTFPGWGRAPDVSGSRARY